MKYISGGLLGFTLFLSTGLPARAELIYVGGDDYARYYVEKNSVKFSEDGFVSYTFTEKLNERAYDGIVTIIADESGDCLTDPDTNDDLTSTNNFSNLRWYDQSGKRVERVSHDNVWHWGQFGLTRYGIVKTFKKACTLHDAE